MHMLADTMMILVFSRSLRFIYCMCSSIIELKPDLFVFNLMRYRFIVETNMNTRSISAPAMCRHKRVHYILDIIYDLRTQICSIIILSQTRETYTIGISRLIYATKLAASYMGNGTIKIIVLHY